MRRCVKNYFKNIPKAPKSSDKNYCWYKKIQREDILKWFHVENEIQLLTLKMAFWVINQKIPKELSSYTHKPIRKEFCILSEVHN